MSWLEFWSSPRGNGSRSPSIEEIVKPYREVIVGTTTPPAATRIEVRSWEDLIRVSDTLGKPILRFALPGALPGHTFYVRDGSTNYVFEFGSAPGGRTAPGPGHPEAPSTSIPGPDRTSPVPITFSDVELATDGRQPPTATTDEAQVQRIRARDLLTRVSALPSSHPAINTALATLSQAIVSLRAGRLAEAERRLDAVDRLIAP